MISDADHPANTGVCVRCEEPRRWPDDFYDGRKVCKECCREQAAERRGQDPEHTRAQDRERKAKQRRQREIRDAVVLEMARRDPFLFHALVWAELKSELGEGQIEDWVARMIPPDPDGVRRGDLKENYRREYGSLMFDKTRYGRKNRRELEDWYSDVGDTDDDDD